MLICTPGPGIGQRRCLKRSHLRGEDRRRRRAQRGGRHYEEPRRGGQGGRRGQVLLASPNALLREFNTRGPHSSKIFRAGKWLPIIKSEPLPCQRHIHSFIHLLFEESKYVLNFIQHLYTSRQHIAFKKLYPCCLIHSVAEL